MSSSLPPIEAVIFDYGGVLSTSPFGRMAEIERFFGLPKGTIGQLTGYGIDVPEPLAGAPYDNSWHLLEIGALPASEWARQVADKSEEILGRRVEPAGLGELLGGMTVQWMVVQRARALRGEGYRLAICTNNIAEFRPHWHSQFPVSEFEVVVDSSEVGVRKPDPRIYTLTCNRLGVAPDRCVFLDDHPGNLVPARDLGMATVLVGADPWAALGELDALLRSRPRPRP